MCAPSVLSFVVFSDALMSFRYADLVVHRLLAAAIGVISLPVGNADRSRQQDLCSHMNRRHRSAQHIQRASCALHTILYFRNRPSVEPAYVLSVLPDRVVVIVPKFGLEGTLLVADIIEQCYGEDLKKCAGVEDMVGHDATAHRLTLSSAGRKLREFQVFQQVLVRIVVQESSGTMAGSSRKIVMSLFKSEEGGTKRPREREETPSALKKKKKNRGNKNK